MSSTTTPPPSSPSSPTSSPPNIHNNNHITHQHHHHAQHHSFLPPHSYIIQQQEQSNLDEKDDAELSTLQPNIKRERLRSIDFISGSIAAIVSDTLLQPLDTVKTRQQFVGDFTITNNTVSNNISNRFVYKNTLDAFITIGRNEGMRGLFRGWVPTMFGSLPAGAIYFGTYESMKRLLLEHSEFFKEYKNFAYMLAGSSAEFMGSLVFVPSELIKCRFQTTPVLNQSTQSLLETNSTTQHNQSSSTFKTFYHVVKNEGIRGLFRGYSATMVRDIPYSMTQFLIYEVLKTSILNRKMEQYDRQISLSTNTLDLENQQELLKQSQKLNVSESIVVGGCAGAVAASLSNPIDVIKTRLQTSTTFKGGFIEMFRKIKQDEGWKGFFKGITPRVMWVTLSTGIMFSVFEFVSHRLTDIWFESQMHVLSSSDNSNTNSSHILHKE